jgi:nucleoside-diphosphate-sugar epimerase
MMRLLITGGSGFIGTNYMDYALKMGINALIKIMSPRS